jgi:aminopeptidase N
MENWGCVSFRAALLLVDDQTSMLVKQRVAQVVCHELSHQWVRYT